jgi:flagellar biosynthesis protein
MEPQEPAPKEEPVKTAIARQYDPNSNGAPRVVATGRGEIADKILLIAQENKVPIREDPILAQALSMVDLDTEIPPELYAVVAEVLGWVYRLRNKTFEG